MSEPKQAVSLIDRAASGKLTLNELQTLAAFFSGVVDTARYYERTEQRSLKFSVPLDRMGSFPEPGGSPSVYDLSQKVLEVSF